MLDVTRRQFLAAASSTLVLGGRAGRAAGVADLYAGLESEKYLGAVEEAAVVEHPKPFTEGPAADRAGRLYFTNVPANHILRFDPADKKLTVFREDTNAANGLLFDDAGRLWACEGGATPESGQVTRMDVATAKIEVVARRYRDFPLGAPNDLTADSKGRIYFTSRLPNTDPQAGNVNAVYRIDPDGQLSQILAAPDIDMPNGIVTSADDKLLYLVESDGREGKSRNIRVYDLQPDGTVKNGRVLITFYPGRSGDGMCIDAEGNLYIAAGLHAPRGTSETLDTQPGIHVVSPAGKLLAFAKTPIDTITNCTFGGPDLKTLYVTCGKYLLQIRTVRPGKAAHRPAK